MTSPLAYSGSKDQPRRCFARPPFIPVFQHGNKASPGRRELLTRPSVDEPGNGIRFVTRHRQRLWVHYCHQDRDWLWVGAGEACNWCGERESLLATDAALTPASRRGDAGRRTDRSLLRASARPEGAEPRGK